MRPVSYTHLGIMELVERTGIHSGDSISVYPAFSISDKVKGTILGYAKKLGLGIGIIGLYNIQFIVDKDENVFIIEAVSYTHLDVYKRQPLYVPDENPIFPTWEKSCRLRFP